MCRHEGQRQKFCELCLLELKAEQGVVVTQFQNRWEELWESRPDLRDQMLELERKHPLHSIEVLSNVTYTTDFPVYVRRGQIGALRGELWDTLQRVLDTFSDLVDEHKDLRIGANDSGFYLYSRRKAT